jgi:transposase
MRVEVLGGVERRRRWSRDDKMRIIEETLTPGATVSEIARRHGIAMPAIVTAIRHHDDVMSDAHDHLIFG